MACVCSRYNACSDWPIIGHYSLVLLMVPLWASKTKAKSHIINNLLTSNEKISNLGLAMLTSLSLGQYGMVSV